MSALCDNRVKTTAYRQRQQAADRIDFVTLLGTKPRCISSSLPQAPCCIEGTGSPLARRRNANGRSA
jgi:hypothetical protein